MGKVSDGVTRVFLRRRKRAAWLTSASMKRDAEHFTNKLGKMDGFGDAGDSLSSIVQTKKIEREAPPAEPVSEQAKSEVKEEESGQAASDADGKEAESEKEKS